MNTLTSSLGDKLKKKEEKENFYWSQFAHRIANGSSVWGLEEAKSRWSAALQIYLLLTNCRVTTHEAEVGLWGGGGGVEMERALQPLLLWYKFLL